MTLRRLATLALVGAGGLLVVAGLLLLPDLYGAIPWYVKKWCGWLAFGALAWTLGARLVRVRPGARPLPGDDGNGAVGSWEWAWSTLGPVLALVLAVPLLRHPANLGFGDWDLFLGKYEAARRSITDYGQFPWWDPWSRGGFPLAANPQCGVLGVAMPLVLAFGTSVGMRLATLACFALAVEGARRLARLWVADPWACGLVGLIYGLNGGVLVASVAAYHLSMCYPALPWMLLFVFRLDRRPSDGFWLGFWAAFNLLNGIQYFTVYQFLIAGVAWVRVLVVVEGSARPRLLRHTAIALGVFLALAGWRLATTGLVYRDFPRVYHSAYDESPGKILNHLLNRPSASFLAGNSVSYFWETTCYIGPVALGLACWSLRDGWRWWHTLALLAGWLAAGSVAWYHPSYWLGHFPVFSTMHAVPRWRFMALLGVALAAGTAVARWRADGRASRRWLANLAIVAIAGDYLAYGYAILPVAFSVAPSEDRFPGAPLPTGSVVQVADGPGFPAIARGYGVVFGYEPLMGYDRRAATARLPRESPDYRGEHWTARGPARVVSWSPNRIELAADPGEEVFINQNPGSWWAADDRPLFPGTRAAEKARPFAVRADDQGRVVLQIRPRGLTLGWALHEVGVLIAAGAWLACRRNPP